MAISEIDGTHEPVDQEFCIILTAIEYKTKRTYCITDIYRTLNYLLIISQYCSGENLNMVRSTFFKVRDLLL
jgi:hypothetical protein